MFFSLFCNEASKEEAHKDSAFLELEPSSNVEFCFGENHELHLSVLRNTPKHLRDLNQPKKCGVDDDKSLDPSEDLFDSTTETPQPSPSSTSYQDEMSFNGDQQPKIVSQKEPFVEEDDDDSWIKLNPSTYEELEKFLQFQKDKADKEDIVKSSIEKQQELEQQLRIIEKENAWYEQRQAKKNKKMKKIGGGGNNKYAGANNKKQRRNNNNNKKSKGMTRKQPLGSSFNHSKPVVAVATV